MNDLVGKLKIYPTIIDIKLLTTVTGLLSVRHPSETASQALTALVINWEPRHQDIPIARCSPKA
jgi:hypothetical protein